VRKQVQVRESLTCVYLCRFYYIISTPLLRKCTDEGPRESNTTACVYVCTAFAQAALFPFLPPPKPNLQYEYVKSNGKGMNEKGKKVKRTRLVDSCNVQSQIH